MQLNAFAPPKKLSKISILHLENNFFLLNTACCYGFFRCSEKAPKANFCPISFLSIKQSKKEFLKFLAKSVRFSWWLLWRKTNLVEFNLKTPSEPLFNYTFPSITKKKNVLQFNPVFGVLSLKFGVSLWHCNIFLHSLWRK